MPEIADVTLRYGHIVALDHVSLRISEGERVAVTGPNGAGKTSLLKALADSAAAERRSSGRVDARTPPVAVVPQYVPPDLAMSVHDFVMLGRTSRLSAWHAPSRADEDAVARALAMVDASELVGRRMDAVSGGERQRLALALALATEAPCLLLDEPAAHLDFRRRGELLALLSRLGKTVVMVLHELPFDLECFTRVILMAAGRIAADGTPDEVLTEANLTAAYGAPVAIRRVRSPYVPSV